MAKETFTINMTKEEMLKFYANKMVENGIKECTEFNTTIDLMNYGDRIDLSKYKNEILQLLYKDERIADVTINKELTVDIVFYTDYCPYYYDEVNELDSKEESKILSYFYYYCSSRIYEEAYIPIRTLITNFVEKIEYKGQVTKENITNILKKNIVEMGFVDKYIENNNETFLTLQNKKEFETLLEIKINELEQHCEEEFE